MAARYPSQLYWDLEAKRKMHCQSVPPGNLNHFNSF
ncbi:hypothetical protein HDF08_002534 [Edaphobacter lichenicola]|uniref:Uncharacterized protein n=1 Tax=Tunturiibacter lichenicola TaxID=2051959 RepID=A0A852VLZ4_9BACT|nr:hypothetical protein [Edaphobacter lichenicola]